MLAAWFGINATDEDLSADALAFMTVAPPPPPSERNGYLDFLALGAVADAPAYEVALSRLRELNEGTKNRFPLPDVKTDERIPPCRPADSPCLEDAAGYPGLRELIERQSPFIERYRAMRDKPEFVDLLVRSSPDAGFPNHKGLVEGSRLSLLTAAIRFNAGDHVGAVEEVEKENSFHRRVGVGSRTLVQKMMSYALLDRDALFVVEMSGKLPAKSPLWLRLEALVREPKEELDIIPGLREEFSSVIGWMKTRDHVRLSDGYYELAKYSPDGRNTRPWWDPVAPFLYRPHQSVNLFAARAKVALTLAQSPSSEFFKATDAASSKLDGLDPSLLGALVINPVGHSHEHLRAYFPSDYIGRMHGHFGMQTLARLIVRMRARGITTQEDVIAALASPLGRAHPDPFSGKPMRFDPRTGTVGFDTELETKFVSGSIRTLIERYGRVALPF